MEVIRNGNLTTFLGVSYNEVLVHNDLLRYAQWRFDQEQVLQPFSPLVNLLRIAPEVLSHPDDPQGLRHLSVVNLAPRDDWDQAITRFVVDATDDELQLRTVMLIKKETVLQVCYSVDFDKLDWILHDYRFALNRAAERGKLRKFDDVWQYEKNRAYEHERVVTNLFDHGMTYLHCETSPVKGEGPHGDGAWSIDYAIARKMVSLVAFIFTADRTKGWSQDTAFQLGKRPIPRDLHWHWTDNHARFTLHDGQRSPFEMTWKTRHALNFNQGGGS